MGTTAPGSGLGEQLARWAAAGLIGKEQAERIEAAETGRADKPPAARPGDAATGGAGGAGGGERRVPLVVEALGYAGGLLAVIAGLAAVQELWPNATAGTQMAFAGTIAAALAGAGAVTPAARNPAFGRLRGLLWLLSAAALAAFTALLASHFLGFSGTATAAATGALTTCYAAVLWLRNRAPAQQFALFAAAALTIASGAAWAAPGLREWLPGLALWLFSLVWGVAVARKLTGPPWAGRLAAGAGLLLGMQLIMDTTGGHVLAGLTVVALLAAGVIWRRSWLLAFGAVGVIQVAPQTVIRYLPRSAAGPLSVFAAGLVLLALALWLARWRGSRGPRAAAPRQAR